MNVIKILVIIIYITINTFLISHNLSCLPFDLISKILEIIKDNPSKSGVILQILYFCILAYFEVLLDEIGQETKLPEKEKENENE